MSQNSISNSLLNVVLVLAESAITLVLRFDPNLRKAVYPLAKKNTVICVRTYLPHTQFFATFTNKGVLLDSQLPKQVTEPDVVINTYSHNLINALISNETTQINKLTMRGATETVHETRHFLVQLGVASLFQGIIKTVKGKGKDKGGKESDSSDKPDYKARIQEQQQQLNALSTRNRELEVSLKELQSKQKLTLIGFVIAAIIAIISVIGWVS
ncbi:hypothetical protein [Psychrobacter sp. FDAARGOS_221]|uniref:hypothetical protein n=1 Tax=Psychrobacter sp. FDAARGOS_221 TaxID=1975705 RepID=UPI000BB556AC|nr:hypothetical protein [Psychrobacter sp. FDAARGOS_221]PNK59982.1 hypothetical protein A6J60_003190 [Psychrobacter sp. FDAARGOS_221]